MLSVPVDLSHAISIAQIGVKRAAGFMALGLHAARDPNARDLFLDSNFKVSFFPRDMTEADLAKVKQTFADWIVANGLRELEQYFCQFIDELYHACLYIKAGTLTPPSLDDMRSNMEKVTNLAKKVKRLDDEFGITSACQSHFTSVSLARNCIAHALGKVRIRDCNVNNPDALRVTWAITDFFLGEHALIRGFEPVAINMGIAALSSGIVQREKVFPVGAKVKFAPIELQELCIMFLNESDVLAQAVWKYAQATGMSISKPQLSRRELRPIVGTLPDDHAT